MNVQTSRGLAKQSAAVRPAILIVEDELILAKDLQRTLIDFGYDAFAIASSAEAAVRRADERRPDLVMMDIRIKGPHDGIQTAGILKRRYSTSIIYLTAHADEATIARVKDTEPHGYLLKPVNVVELRTTVEIALHKHQCEQARAAKAEMARQEQTEVMEMGRVVRESNELFRMTIEAVKDYAIFMLDPDGRVASWNIGAERLKGFGKQEIVGQHFARFYTDEDIADHKPERILETAARLGRAEDQGWRVRRDGTRFYADVVVTAVYESTGQVRGFAKVTRDVTARKNAERRLYETSSLLRAVLDSATEVSIIATDPSMTIQVFNVGAERLLGYDSKEVVGRTTLLLHDPEELRVYGKELSAQMGREIEGAEIFKLASTHGRSREWSYVRKDGSRIVVDLVVTPMQTYEGDLLGYVGVAQDVTQHKQHEESLRRATQEAERANGAKSLFLANMSHEIRTPMNAMIGLTYLLGQTSLNADQTGLLAQINVASKLLLAVITDVLDISKIEAGELMISRVAFSPRELLHGLHAIMHAQAESKGITLVLDVPDNLPEWLEGDAARLNQILANLLSNAIKFTERGGVTLCVRVLDISSKGSKLSFAVRDTGIGIDPAAQARLFTPFIQADESITRRYGGTGLGLSIIHSLAKLMGGTVDFTSAVAAGSEFRVVLDFALATSESLAVAQPASLGERPVSGVRVLVVDDYELNLVVTRRILEQAGAVVWVANTGQEALRALQLQSDQFDVVLMDVQMPIMDGYEATRRIRADLGLRELPIIALTAGALFSERQRATAVGMDDFISKPFDAATLISSVMQHTVSARVRKEGVRSAPRVMKERVDWPEIEGIDMGDARKRLCDDPALFRSLLRRFLEDFSDMAILSSRSGPVELEQLGCRLHKLRGAAGVLGAKAIQGLAAGAEAACVAGDAAGSEELLIELAMHMDALRERVTRARIETPCKDDRGADSVGLCRVLLVDDDHIVRAHVANLLERAGYRIGEAASGDEALRTLRGGDYQIVITDWKMPGMSGIELCHALRVGIDSRDLRVIMLTMSDAQQDADLCREAGADAYILKSAPNEEIIACVDAARNSVLGLV